MHASPQIALMTFRIGFGLFLLVWGLNKIVNPGHTARVFENFYFVEGLSTSASVFLGIAQVALSLAIIAGFYKTVSYGLGVLVHGISTLATAPHLLLPLAEGSNLLFMAAVPVLTGAIGLFLARDADTMLSVDRHLSLAQSPESSSEPAQGH